MSILEVKNLKKNFGANTVLKDVSLKFEKAKLIGIIGANGCGKSTLLKTVLGLVSQQGGSITVDQIGLKEEVLNKFSVINRDAAKSPEERMELMRQALTCDTFLMSANAITEDGQLVNIDGNGNRVAALCFGPKEVIVVAGMNKVVGSLEDAWDRARNYAAPVNAQRFELPTPCGKTGLCADCKNSSTICTHFVVTRMGKNGRIKVILVGEELGF